ncbi:TPA: hypothetical protein ACH3X3_003981 [Trebouxia sp. C0006]
MPVSLDAEVKLVSSVGRFNGFQVEKVLGESDRTKFVAVLGRWTSKPDQAVVLLSRRPFDTAGVQGLLETSLESELLFQNDVYSKYTSMLAPAHGAITVDIIYPASEKHISKYSMQKFVMVAETSVMYSEKVLPFIQALPASSIMWVYNVLEKKAEADRLLFEDPHPTQGFMLHPDLKWD